ncbi:MAG: hypothetical protein COW30_11690 [Rhodospirillales bacterium CG15_BIG_FIL_POST_REV_8_21_14_020_66_15]|nr:MAG: hypothetical protein COW30_11690 [Rhodospirillales bacterium CG15_BIG_FIL_POST_REV_8_21_14_020_66_15]
MAKPQIINPPNRLKSKVSMGGPGAVDPERIARAEAAVEKMTANYLDWVETDLKKLETELAALKPGAADTADRTQAIYRISHDIKGQGGSFGYQLMTEVGALMCRYIENMDGDPTQEDINLMALCYKSMRAVISGRLAGDGGEAGRMVLDGLGRVAEKVKAVDGL